MKDVQPTNAPGKIYLKTAGILFLVYGGIGLLISAIIFIYYIIIFEAIVFFLSSLFTFIVGLIGIINCAQTKNVNLCLVLAIISIVLNVFGPVSAITVSPSLTLAYGIMTYGTVYNLVGGIPFSILYLIGVIKNKKAA